MLDADIIDKIYTGPTQKYRKHYKEINTELNSITEKIAELAITAGYNTLPIRATVPDEDLDDNYYKTLRLFFSHKMAATLAGLGWIGETDLLLDHTFGPRIRLATILTDRLLGQPEIPILKKQM